MTTAELKQAIENEKARSAWDKAKKVYAIELVEQWEGNNKGEEFNGSPANKKDLLNGAEDWKQYSYGGCSLIYDYEIAERVCSPSEYKKTREGERQPNANETWLDVQARILYQAASMIMRLAKQ